MHVIDRALGLLLALSGGKPVAASALARRFEVSLRTIYRDIDRLLRLGVPVEAERGAQGGYRLAEGYLQPPVGLTRAETAALLVALAVARGLRATPFEADLDTAAKKLLASLPGPARALLKEGHRIVAMEPAPEDLFHWEKPVSAPLDARAPVDGFLSGILKSRRVRFVYENPYRATLREHDVEPQGILFDRDRWYLIGHSLDHGDERIWRADKVRSIAVTGFAFRPDREFDVRRYQGRSWLAAAFARWFLDDERNITRIRLTPELAALLQRDWFYQKAHFAAAADGAIVMSVPETDPRSIQSLVRWLGPDAEILSPEPLRRQFAEQAGRAAALYR